MRSRSAIVVLMALAVALLTWGCSSDGDDITKGIPLPGKFPGNDVADSNHAADARALSENGMSVMDGPRVFHSSKGNRSITLYTTMNTMGNPSIALWAVYFDGKRVMPPAEIRTVASSNNPASPENDGKRGDFMAPVELDGTIVMFYDPSDVKANAASDRAGDAVILFARRDVNDADPSLPVNDDNERLWWCYFDKSMAKDRDMGYGFGTFESTGEFRPGYADIVDSDDGDNDDTNENPGFNAIPDDVMNYGFVSDGIHGEAIFFGGGPFGARTNLFNTKDFQDYLVAVWTQIDEVNSGPASDSPDLHLWSSRFDITADPPGFVQPSRIRLDTSSLEETTPTFPDPTTFVLPILLVYNNSIVFQIAEDPGGDDDSVYQYNHYTGTSSDGFTGGAFLTNSVEFSPPNDPTDGDSASTSDLPMLYGGDHGLDALFCIFSHNVNNSTPNPDDDDDDLYVARFDPTALTGSAAFSPTGDRALADDSVVNPPTPRIVFDYDSRISRDGDYILIAYLQEDANGISELKVRSLTPDPTGSLSGAISASDDISDVTSNAPVTTFQFQGELGMFILPPDAGESGMRRGAVQSDNDRMHFLYQLNDDGGTLQDELYVAQYDHLGPQVSTDPVDTFPDSLLDPIENVARLLDNGDGGAIVYYARDLYWDDPTVAEDMRLHAVSYDGNNLSARLDINTPGLSVRPQSMGVLTVGTQDPAGSRHGIFFGEDRYATSTGNPASGDAIRFRWFDKITPGGTFDVTLFTPTHTVDLDVSGNAEGIGGTTRGGTDKLALYFRQNGHVYYNEYNPAQDAWLNPANYIVDNDSSTNFDGTPIIAAYRPYLPPDMVLSGETAGATIWWLRFDSDMDLRLYVRVHD